MSEQKVAFLLDPIESKTKLDQVIERITKAVATGELKSGDQLPGERQVAEALQVSRAVVREAYSALQLAGLVERKVGTGSFISKVENPPVLQTRARAIVESSPDPYMLWGAREALESSLWDLIQEGSAPEDVHAIEDALEDMEHAVLRNDLDRLFEADRRFHVSLVCATHNPYVTQSLTPLLSEMNSPLHRVMKESTFLSIPGTLAATARIHRKIYSAIQNASSEEFRASMREHFKMLLAFLDESLNAD